MAFLILIGLLLSYTSIAGNQSKYKEIFRKHLTFVKRSSTAEVSFSEEAPAFPIVIGHRYLYFTNANEGNSSKPVEGGIGFLSNGERTGNTSVLTFESTRDQIKSEITAPSLPSEISKRGLGTDEDDDFFMTLGTDIFPFDFQSTKDGGYIIVGDHSNSIFTAKLDHLGNCEWALLMKYIYNSSVKQIFQTHDGGFIVGVSIVEYPYKTLFVRMSPKGEEIWSKSCGGWENDQNLVNVQLEGILEDKAGQIVWVGQVFVSNMERRIAVGVLDDSGGLIQAMMLNWGADATALTISPTQDGGVVISASEKAAFLMKLDSNHNIQWVKKIRFGGANYKSSFKTVLELKDGGYLAGGEICDLKKCSPLFAKLDESGVIIWAKYIENNVGGINSIVETADDSFVLTSDYMLTPGETGKKRNLIIKISTFGDLIWTQLYGNDIARCRMTNDSNLIVLVREEHSQLLLVKFNQDGIFPSEGLQPEPIDLYEAKGLAQVDNLQAEVTSKILDLLSISPKLEDFNISNAINMISGLIPLDILLENYSKVPEHISNFEVGSLLTIHSNNSDLSTYKLASGMGDDDNLMFNVLENGTLSTATGLDGSIKKYYSIRVRSTDSNKNIIEKSFAIMVDYTEEPSSKAGLIAGIVVAVAIVFVGLAIIGVKLYTRNEKNSFKYKNNKEAWVEIEGKIVWKEEDDTILLNSLRDAESLIRIKNDKGLNIILGNGSHSVIYLGKYRGKAVAIKEFEEDDNIALQYFKNQCKTMNNFNHPNIIKFQGILYKPACTLIMEVAPKGDLENVLQTHILSWNEKYILAYNLTQGLAAMHNNNYIHCDITTKHVLVDDQLVAKLSGFSISTFGTRTSQTYLDRFGDGSVIFLAPELLGDRPIYSKASDIYALGVVFWEMSWDTPFRERIAGRKFGTVRLEILNECPFAFASLIKSCWNKDPKARPDVDEILLILERCIDSFKKHDLDGIILE